MYSHTPISVTDLVQDKFREWIRAKPASEEGIKALKKFAGFELPEDYLTFLRLSNGGEGELGVQPGWFQIWSAEEIPEFNQDYKVEKLYPGYFGIGSSGGGEMFAFRKTGNDLGIYMVPFIGGPEYACAVTESFEAMVHLMGQVWD